MLLCLIIALTYATIGIVKNQGRLIALLSFAISLFLLPAAFA
jgi:hypothetical protein